MAGSFLKEQLGVDFHHIPIYPTNRYSGEVHRLLQVTANLYDSTTNRGDTYPWFPTCFRPLFGTNGDEVFISGYVEQPGAAFNLRPWRDVEDADDRPIDPDDNIYGIPIILGVKKGFPNFNEFALQTTVDVTRKLALRKASITGPLIETNQLYLLGISNTVAMEWWQPWDQDYPRNLFMKALVETTCTLTNDHGFAQTSFVTNATNLIWRVATNGFRASQFRVPIPVTTIMLSNSIFRTEPAEHFEPAPAGITFEQSPAFPTNHWGLTTKTRLVLCLFDDTHLVDYVALSDLASALDLSGELNDSQGDPYLLWDPQWGIGRQIEISSGNIAIPDWNAYGVHQFTGTDKQIAIGSFRNFLSSNPSPLSSTNLLMQAPFTPTRKMVQSTTWEANDPFVHQCTQHFLAEENRPRSTIQSVILTQPTSISDFTSIGRLNDNYQPWGGNPQLDPSSDLVAMDPSIKDPGVASCNDWQFPSNSPLTFATIGEVHRGTPWQTVYLKSAIASPDRWRLWHGDPSGHPTNDWGLVDVLWSLLQTNVPQNLLSVNSTNLEAWSAAFEGLVVSSNSQDCAIGDVLLTSQTPEIPSLIDGLRRNRTATSHAYFDSLGAILRTPELSFLSPWVDLHPDWVFCVRDEQLESLPGQLLSRLRPDPIATVLNRASGQMRFVVLPDHTYEVQSSRDLRTWETIDTRFVSERAFSFAPPPISTASFYRLKLLN